MMDDGEFLSKLEAKTSPVLRSREVRSANEDKLGAIMLLLYGEAADGHLAKRIGAVCQSLTKVGAYIDADAGSWHFGAKFRNKHGDIGTVGVALQLSRTDPDTFIIKTFVQPGDPPGGASQASFPFNGYSLSEIENFIDTSLLSAMEAVMASVQP